MTFSGSASSSAQFPRDGLPEVAFLGRSNVGKSSLLNALAGAKGLARVSSSPGRTRLINFFNVKGLGKSAHGGHSELYLVDLPGYGYAKASRSAREEWERLVNSYLEARETLQLCVFIVDARHEPSEGDQTLRTWLDHHGHPYVVAANKMDKMSRDQGRRRARSLGETIGPCAEAVVPVSATKGTGIGELWNHIRAAAFDRPFEASV